MQVSSSGAALSPLEQEVAGLESSGLSARAIAAKLGRTLQTVKMVRWRLKRKLARRGSWVVDDETPVANRRRIAAEVASGARCKKCLNPVGHGCTADSCDVASAAAFASRRTSSPWDGQ